MTENAKQITYRTFILWVSIKDLAELFPFYDWKSGHQDGIRMKKDWAVSWWRSTYKGKRCYYVSWSGIEFIFQKGEPDETSETGPSTR